MHTSIVLCLLTFSLNTFFHKPVEQLKVCNPRNHKINYRAVLRIATLSVSSKTIRVTMSVQERVANCCKLLEIAKIQIVPYKTGELIIRGG